MWVVTFGDMMALLLCFFILLQTFSEHTEELETASGENRTQVMTALPSMLRRLPSTALGWVGMEQISHEMRLVTDPG